MCIATAQIVIFLSLLFDIFSLKFVTKILNGFIVIFQPIVTVTDMEVYVLVVFDCLYSLFKTIY